MLWSAFPPQAHSDAAWMALVPLLLIIRQATPRGAAFWAWCTGLLFWLATLSWFPAIIKNGGPWPLVFLGQLGLSAWCAAFWALFACCSALVRRWAGRAPAWQRVVAVTLIDPIMWAGAELLRGTLFSGFAWNFIGVSQVDNLPVVQIASILGVYGVSSLVVLINGAIASIVERLAHPVLMRLKVVQADISKRQPAWGARLLLSVESMLPLALVIFCWCWGMLRIKEARRQIATAPTWRVALVQPNTPCIFTLGSDVVRAQLELLLNQTRLAAVAKPDLTIWPETAVLGSVPDDPFTMRFIRDGAAAAGAPLLTGTLEKEATAVTPQAPDGFLYYNAAWLFAASGEFMGRYRKRHLVPFGEYIPLDKRIPVLQRLAPTGVSCTPGRDPGILHITRAPGDELAIGPLICFEDTVASLSRAAVRAGARMLTLMTNDAWFNGSIEPVQHLHQSIFRAVENGVPLVRVANSGVSCTVECTGGVTRLTSGGVATDFDGFLVTQVQVPQTPLSAPYTRWGDWPWAIPGAVLLVLLAIGEALRGKLAVTEKWSKS